MDLVTLEPSCQPDVAAAFQRLASRRAGHYVSYLADPAILDFHRDRIVSQLQQSAASSPLYGWWDQDRLAALAGVIPSPWHTQHYGIPYLKIQPWFLFEDHPDVVRLVVECLRSSVMQQQGAVYALRVEAHNAPLSYWLSRMGAAHVGTSIRMVRDDLSDAAALPESAEVRIREVRPEDISALQDLARTSHRHSHFFQEMAFPLDKTQDLFAAWLRRCTETLAERVWVAEHGGRPVGFALVLLNPSLVSYVGKRIGIIDFILVDAAVQGKGIGKMLLDASMAWFSQNADIVELRTMVDNVSAIRFYEKNGFRALSADHHYHFWT